MKKKRKLKKSVKIAIAFVVLLLIATYGKSSGRESVDFTHIENPTKYVEEFQKRAKEDDRYNEVIQNIDTYPEDVIKLLYSNGETLDIENPTKYVEEFQKRAKEDDRYNEVIQNIDTYPEDVIKLLYSNGETLDFVLSRDNFKKPAFLINVDEECGDGKIPRLQQWDPKWGWREYGNNVIAINGCGPTALSMVVSGLTGDKDITPIKIAKYSDKHGFHEVAGTNWNLMVEGAKKYGVKGWAIDNTKSSFESALKNGSRGCKEIWCQRLGNR